MTYYGIEQANHGHWYRWIFDEDTIKNELGYIPEDGLDIGWPIGGSNSSATWIMQINNDDEVLEWLTMPSEPDLEDPTLVDIGEHLMTIATDEGCAQMFLNKLGMKADDLAQYDDCYGRRNEIEQKVKELREMNVDFDCNNPFYGNNRGMRYSEFCEMYDQIKEAKA